MTRENLLMVADSERDANMRYAAGYLVEEPIVFLRLTGKKLLVLNDLEIPRARKYAPHCRVIRLSACVRKLQRDGVKRIELARVISSILRERRIKKVVVPWNFPLGLARKLRGLDIKVKAKEGDYFAEREIKTAEEIKKISAALIMAEVGLAEGIHALKNSRIAKNGRLIYHNVPLTSEKLRSIIEIAIIHAGGLANHTIVAAGKQGCDPREQGHGELHANQPIVLEVFPRSQKTGYFADITRTVVRGRARDSVRKLYDTVARAQDLAFTQISHGRLGSEVHNVVDEFFDKEGYKSSRRNGRMTGFCHGTGRGLGLEVREAPRISSTSRDVLRSGHVVSVEPGLYYPEIGGVRLEDLALVTAQSPRNLTKFEKTLEV